MTGSERSHENGERQPLLHRHSQLDAGEGGDSRELVQFGEEDSGNPRQWKYSQKLANTGVICCMAILSPLASSMFTPGIDQIAEGLDTNAETVIGCAYTCSSPRSGSSLTAGYRYDWLRDHVRNRPFNPGTSLRDLRSPCSLSQLFRCLHSSANTKRARTQY